MKKLYVGNLPFQANEEEVQALFSESGIKADSVALIRDRFSGQPRGFGFVEIGDDGEADKAVAALNGKDFKGRKIVVNEARPQREGGGGGGGGGRGRSGGGGGGGWAVVVTAAAVVAAIAAAVVVAAADAATGNRKFRKRASAKNGLPVFVAVPFRAASSAFRGDCTSYSADRIRPVEYSLRYFSSPHLRIQFSRLRHASQIPSAFKEPLMPREIKTLLSALEEAYKGPAWHGPSLRAALKGIDAKQAAKRLGPAVTTSGN